MNRTFKGSFTTGTAKTMEAEKWLTVLNVENLEKAGQEHIEFEVNTQQRFTTRPNSDVFTVEDQFDVGLYSLEVWEKDNRLWVLAIRDDGRLVQHTAIGNSMAAMILKRND